MALLSKSPAGICQCKAILVVVCSLYLLLLPLQLQAGIVTCQNCETQYNNEDFPSCPICNQASSHQTPPTQAALQHSQQLAIQLFTLAAEAQPDSNFVFSPDSLFQALSLVLMGATDATQKLLADYLGGACHTPSGAELNTTPGQGEVYSVGNCLLLASRYQLQQTYRAELEKMNAIVHEGIDFTNTPSLQTLAQQLNQHFCQLTQGMIPSFCNADQWSSDTALTLINSVYFRGLWQIPFYRERDGGFFTLANGTRVHLSRVLHQELHYSEYAIQNGWQAVTVPYQGAHEMVLVLPPEGTTLSGISPEIITNLFSSLQSVHEIDLHLPAFETNSETDLNSVLTRTGLGCLFQSGGVSLGGMLVGSSEAIFLSDVKQNCAIKVNEKGTEAAAITQTEFFDGPGSDIYINFNRPFLYILRHKETGRILFIGQILHPEVLNN